MGLKINEYHYFHTHFAINAKIMIIILMEVWINFHTTGISYLWYE